MAMNKLELVSEAVQEICDRLNDPDLIKYADSSTYEGRAMTNLFRAIREVLENPNRYGVTKFDYRGLMYSEELTIGGASNETGIILYSDFDNLPKEIYDIYTNSDSSNDQLPFNLKKINAMLPMYAEEEENQNSPFYIPEIDTVRERGWYPLDNTETGGSRTSIGIKFYPKDGTGEQEYYVTVDYLAELDIGAVTKDTVLWIGTSNGKFTRKFIDKIIDIATTRILREREI